MSCHGGDFFTDVASLSDGKNVLIGEKGAPGPLDRILGGDHRADTPEASRLCSISMWRILAWGSGLRRIFADQHTGKMNVGDELGSRRRLCRSLRPVGRVCRRQKIALRLPY